MQKKSLKDIEINKEFFRQIWKKLNETKVEDILPYFKKNKGAALGGILLLVFLCGGIYLVKYNMDVLKSGKTGQTTAVSPPATVDPKLPVSTFLPQEKRTLDQTTTIKDPFASKMKLKGIMTGGGGTNLAIIELGNTSYIAKPGTEISQGLFVEEIRPDLVLLKSKEERMYLEFGGRTKTEKLNTDKQKSEDQEKESGQEPERDTKIEPQQ
ncbi:hypothetical protein [Desulfotomaculum sp. 1211_IL3151]|uniref:hypothetical protein n=1 Tax=Desulfotomaculum sp. 1211_IL3151 TaxID=3084055 RepID=UPI002FD9BD95